MEEPVIPNNKKKCLKITTYSREYKDTMWKIVPRINKVSIDVDKQEREFCEKCDSIINEMDDGFTCCVNPLCASINIDKLDQGPEWRYYGADDTCSSDPTRCGMPTNPLLVESSLGCKAAYSPGTSYEMRKIGRYIEFHGMPYNEKIRYDEFNHIRIMASQGGIPTMIIEDAMRCHATIFKYKSFRGDNRDGIIAATIYIACKKNNCPRTSKEIASIFHLDQSSATRGCKNACSIINVIENEFENIDKTELCITTPQSFIDRYCSRLNITPRLTKLCNFIAIRINNSNSITENTPNSIAAGIVYFVIKHFNIDISKKSVSIISEISEVTINKCYKKLKSMSDQLIPASLDM